MGGRGAGFRYASRRRGERTDLASRIEVCGHAGRDMRGTGMRRGARERAGRAEVLRHAGSGNRWAACTGRVQVCRHAGGVS